MPYHIIFSHENYTDVRLRLSDCTLRVFLKFKILSTVNGGQFVAVFGPYEASKKKIRTFRAFLLNCRNML